jgi:F-type H+-transporting ATPase subunit epsilon
MKELHIEIVTPSKVAYKGEILSASVPGTNGNFQILYNHAPIISSLEVGIIKIVELDSVEKHYSTSGGTIEVSNNNIILLVESFESPEEIDIKRAEESKGRAKERLSIGVKDVDQIRAEMSLKRALNRIKICKTK